METVNSTPNFFIEGTDSNDSITNTASGKNVTINGAAGNDTITNNGDNVSINGGDGDDVINLNGGTGATVNTSDGDDTINVSATLPTFTVEGFSSGDAIQFANDVTAIDTIDGGVVVTAGEQVVTVHGLNTSEVNYSWNEGTSTVSYTAETVSGIGYNGSVVSYTKGKSSTLFTINGLGTSAGLLVDDSSVVTVTAAALDGVTGTVSINNGYTLSLSGVNTVAGQSIADTWTVISGNAAYVTGRTQDYFTGNGTATVSYVTGASGAAQVELSNITVDDKLAAPSDGTVNLIADNFAGNVTVVSNAGGYSFAIGQGNYNRTFTGTSGNDTIINEGQRVTINALGGDDYIANVVDSSVTTASLGNYIDAGDGNDTLYSDHTYNSSLIGGAGNDSIVVSRGHLTYADGGAGDDTILGTDASVTGSDWHMGGYATLLGGEGNDYIAPGYTNNSSIDGGNGDDTIVTNGQSATIDGGAGNNLITLTNEEEGETGQFIVLNGNTTVENFGTGFDNTSDTLYINGDSPAVDFKENGLTFYRETEGDSITLKDVNETTKFHLYYADDDKTVAEIFIADDDWYTVTGEDMEQDMEVYFVGATSKINHGVDFSGISSALDVTINTEYEIPDNSIWINNVHSIRGGAGATKITGSSLSDTIETGGANSSVSGGAGDDYITNSGDYVTIDAGAGEDFVYNYGNNVTISGKLGDDSINNYTGTNVLFNYASGDGNDTIIGFNTTSTLDLGGATYSSVASGSNLIVTVDDENITLVDVLNLSTVNIVGNYDGALNITNTADNTLIIGTPYADTIYNSGQNVTIDAKADDDLIVSGGKNVSIEGGAGNDTIIMTGADATLSGGAGNDHISLGTADSVNALIQYTNGDGNDLITGYTSNDTIKISGSTYSSVTSGDDLILIVGDDKITLQGAANLDTVHIDGTLSGGNIFNPEHIIHSSFWKLVVEDNFEIVDLSYYPNDLKVVGNALDNVIVGGKARNKLAGGKGGDLIIGGKKRDMLSGGTGDDEIHGGAGNDELRGGAGNDSLWGDAGNDSLWGGKGADTFFYAEGDGRDVIYGFDKNDLLEITGVFTASYDKSTKEISFTVGKTANAITLKEFTATTFNINGDSYQIKGSQFVKK